MWKKTSVFKTFFPKKNVPKTSKKRSGKTLIFKTSKNVPKTSKKRRWKNHPFLRRFKPKKTDKKRSRKSFVFKTSKNVQKTEIKKSSVLRTFFYPKTSQKRPKNGVEKKNSRRPKTFQKRPKNGVEKNRFLRRPKTS